MLNKLLNKFKSMLDKNDKKLPKDVLMNYLEESQFIRYQMYIDIWNFVNEKFHDKNYINPNIVEFGGSNTLIKAMFNSTNYEIAPNYPDVDLSDLSNYQSNSIDFIILDQVLEHVEYPIKAINEIYRVLKNDGWLICTTPFLIQIHNVPCDYWRFTKDGMIKLLDQFDEVYIESWGNRKTAVYHIENDIWPTTAEIREQGYFDLTNEERFPYVIWSYAKK